MRAHVPHLMVDLLIDGCGEQVSLQVAGGSGRHPHPAPARVPIVPLMPHGKRDLGLFDPQDDRLPDTLNRFEHWWATPVQVQVILFLFGFATAGVPFEQVGPGTAFVLLGLLLGKPLGILAFSLMARLAGVHLPAGLRWRDLTIVGVTASMGFTVSLFFATAAFDPGPELAEDEDGHPAQLRRGAPGTDGIGAVEVTTRRITCARTRNA